MGNSSSGDLSTKPVPGLRMGNSSSSAALGIGIGFEILPRMDDVPGRDRPGLAGEADAPLNSFIFDDGGGLGVEN